MLATLNLQLSPVELLDDTLTSSAPLLPDAGGEVESGFGDLLRLRVDASLPSDPTGGELLPFDGSDLPILSQPAVAETAVESMTNPETAPEALNLEVLNPEASNPELIKLMPQLTAEGNTTPLSDRPDIVLDDAVLYPPLNEASAEAPASLLMAPPLPTDNAVRLDTAAAEAAAVGRGTGDTMATRSTMPDAPHATRPELAARIQDVLTTGSERPAIPPASTGLHERGQFGMPRTSTPLATHTAVANESLPLVDLPKRPDTTPLQPAVSLDDAVTETVQPRGTVPSPVQALHAQLNTQPSQVMFTASPAAAGESTYATAVQQATDLIGTPVRDTAWGERIGERVLMMTGNQLKTAEIRLTPAELGPLRVQVSVDDGAANVTFHAQHAVTREALEQAMPRLREMLAENGLSLGQADVSEQGVSQGNKDTETDVRESNQSAEEAHDGGLEDDRRMVPGATASLGLVDTFA